MNRFFLLSVVLFIGQPLGAVAGQENGEDAVKVQAEEYFRRGEALAEAGEYVQAAQAFHLAYETLPHPSVLLNIAVCYENAGKVVRAVEIYRQYLSEITEAEDGADIQIHLSELEQRVGQVTVDCAVPLCKILLDGVQRGEAPITAVVLPGNVRVEAIAEGVTFTVVDLTVRAGGHIHLQMNPNQIETEPKLPDVESRVVEPEPPVVQLEDQNIFRRLSLPFWLVGGVAVVSGGVTIVTGARTLHYRDVYENSGNTDKAALDKGERAKLTANIMVGVTAVAALGAVGLAIRDLKRNQPRQAELEEARLAVIPGPGTLALIGRF